MSKCLDESRIRAVADDEATASEVQHVEGCDACRVRVDEARRAANELTTMTSQIALPPAAKENIARAIVNHRVQGATTLRTARATSRPARLWMSAGAVAAAAILVVVLLPPIDAPRDLSAAEVLDRSVQTLSAANGTELREFDLELRLPTFLEGRSGKFRIEQLVDHDAPGRYRVARFAEDGTLLDALSEDPVAGRRVALVHVDGQPFTFGFAIDRAHAAAMRDLERHHVAALLRVLQTMAGENVREVGRGPGKRYIVEIPSVADARAGGLWEIDRARVVIRATDFQVLELSAAGSYMGQDVGLDFRLHRVTHRTSASVPAAEFELPVVPGAIAIEGQATSDVARDILTTALRELGRLENRRSRDQEDLDR
jgi:hypothetical protein